MRTYTTASASPFADWLAYFTRNRANRIPIHWEQGVHLSLFVQKPLIHSLQRFQVGEQGDGRHLKQHAAQRGDSTYAAALDLFIREEQEHSRLLAQLLGALNADLLDSHWSDMAFVLLRNLSGLHLELLILLVAEIIAKRYYRALAEGIGDPVAHAVFQQIVHDEQGHVAFHCDLLRRDFASLHALVRLLIRQSWHIIFAIVSVVVLLDHRAILRATSIVPSEFLRDCNALFNETANEIFGG